MTLTADDSNERRIILAFNERYWSDLATGGARPLAHYLQFYPDYERVVAEEYLAIHAGGAADEATDAGKRVRGISEHHLGPYTLDLEIGRGGQGVVYKATDTRLGRTVALKVLTGLGPGAESQVARFRREAEAASRLDHPGICGVHDAGIESGVPYIAMRYVDGETLASRISRSKCDSKKTIGDSFESFDDEQPRAAARTRPSKESAPPSATRVEIDALVAIFEKVARALHAAHEAGVLHRDIKPGNIMVTAEEEPVLLDFGLASIESDDAGPTLTRTGDLFGTPAYMSPEQLTGQRVRIDRRSDVYSLGVALFECLTRSRPFEAPTREALYQAVLTKEAPDPRQLNRAISVDLAVVVATALAKDRDKRYQSALALAEDLAAILDSRPIAARPIGPIGKLVRWIKRRPMRAALLLALVIGIPLVTGLSGYIWANLPNIEAQKRAQIEETVELFLESGFFELHEGEPAKSIESFEKAIELAPDSAEAVVGAALAHLKMKQPQSALATIETGERRVKDPGVLARAKGDVLVALGRLDEAARVTAAAPPIRGSLHYFLEGTRAMNEGHAAREESEAADAAFERAVAMFSRAVASSAHARRAYHLELAHAVGHTHDAADCDTVVDAIAALWPDSAIAWRWIGYAQLNRSTQRNLEAVQKVVELEPDRPESWANLGHAFFRNGQPDRAFEAFLRAKELGGVPLRERQVYGIVLATQKRSDEAIAVFEEEIKRDANNTTVHFNYGIALDALGRTEDAALQFQKSAVIGNNHSESLRFLAAMLQKLGRDAEAIEELRKVVALRPSVAAHHSLLGKALRRFGKVDEAIAEQKEAVRLDRNLVSAHRELVEMFERSQRPAEAVEFLLEIVRLMPKDALPRAYLAKLLSQLDRNDEAIKWAEAAIALDPKVSDAYLWLGAALSAKGQTERATAMMKKAIDLDPSRADYFGGLGQVEESRGDIRAATAAYQKAVALEPKNPLANTAFSRLALQNGDFEAAIRHAKIALESIPDDPEGLFYWAAGLDASGNSSEAISVLETAVSKITRDADLFDLQSRILARLERYEDAVAAAERGAKFHPRSASLRYRWASSLKLLGRWDEAIGEFREAIRLDPQYAEAHCDLGLLFAHMGNRFSEAVPLIRRGHELGIARGAAWQFPSLIWLDQAVADWARELDDRNETKKAVEVLKRHLKDFPGLEKSKALLEEIGN